MTLVVTHAKVSAVADDPSAAAAGEVLPSDWNAVHTVTGVLLLSQLPQLIIQPIVSGGPQNISANSDVVQVNQTIGSPIQLTMPLASSFSSRSGSCIICDWKGDSGANAITINLSGSDKFSGNISSWIINDNMASIRLTPIPGAGYAI